MTDKSLGIGDSQGMVGSHSLVTGNVVGNNFGYQLDPDDTTTGYLNDVITSVPLTSARSG